MDGASSAHPDDDHPTTQPVQPVQPVPRTVLSVWDRDLRNTGASAGYAQWFGVDPTTLRGMHVRDVIGDAAFRDREADFAAALAGRERDAERTVATRQGERRCRIGYVPLHDATGVGGLFMVLHDIHDLVEAEQDLSAAQELGRMGSYTYDPRTEALTCSRQMLRILGLDPTGPSPTLAAYLDAVHPDDRALVEDLRDRRAPRGGYEASYRVVRPDGSVRHVHSRTRQDPAVGSGGVRLRGVMQDETRTQEVAARLTAANAVLNDVLGLVGHDLRQPVTVVAGYLDHLDTAWDDLDEESRRHYLGVARRVSERLVHQTRDLLAVVDRSTAALLAHPQPVDLATTVAAAAALAEVEVEVDVSAVPVDRVLADPVHLRQVLVNLLVNAGRYGEPPVQVDAVVDGAAVVIEVADHGTGVSADFVPRLFERFTQAQDGAHQDGPHGGVGLGLHIVRELVRANGGTVSYRDGSPRGAVFVVRLPLDD